MNRGRASHGFDHIRRVSALCHRLGRELSADMEVLELAALLHDIGRDEQDRSGGKKCHALSGADTAAHLLRDHGAGRHLVKKVTDCIRQHRYRSTTPPASLEAKILWDADKIDSLGAVGVGRAFLFAGEVGARLHNTEAEARRAKSYSPGDTAYREYLVKLKGLPRRLKTAAGRRVARDRAAFMEIFFCRLDDEVKGRL
jgi:uncharacterized protein